VCEQDVVRLRYDAFRLEVMDDGPHVEIAAHPKCEELTRTVVAALEHRLGFGEAFAEELVDDLAAPTPPDDHLTRHVRVGLGTVGEGHLARPAAVRRVQLD
jgi:hypothetical protein